MPTVTPSVEMSSKLMILLQFSNNIILKIQFNAEAILVLRLIGFPRLIWRVSSRVTVLRDIFLNVNNSTNKQQKKLKLSERTSIMLFKVFQYCNVVCL